jgi:hypothetical protein
LGKEAVVAIVEQGPTIATLWGTIRSKLVLPPTESVGAIALRGSVDAARTAITESRDACNQMKSRMAIPFEVYTNAANALLERQKAELQDSLRTIRGHAMELDSQRMAIVTATQSLGESLTEEEAAKVKGLREEVEGIAKRLTLESVQPEVLRIQPVLEGIQTNPFVVSAMQKGLERIVKMGDETVQAMRDRVEQFREFRQSLAERLTTVLDEQRRNLRDEYEMIRKSAVAEEIARLDREFEPGFQRIQSVSTNIPALLTAIGEVGRLRSLLTFTS